MTSFRSGEFALDQPKLLMPRRVEAFAKGSRTPLFTVACVGHALNDTFAFVRREDLIEEGLTPGRWHQIKDLNRMRRLRSRFPTSHTVAAGSSANTAHIVARLDGPSVLLTAIGDLEAGGRHFVGSHVNNGIAVGIAKPSSGTYTGQSINLLTPDGERTFLSDETGMRPEAWVDVDGIDADVIQRSYITLLQATQATKRAGIQVLRHTAQLAHAANRKVALSLNHINPEVVSLHGRELLDFLADDVDICLANSDEMTLLMGTADPHTAARELSREVHTVVGMTRGADGATVIERRCGRKIPAIETKPGNMIGAGDAFAAGLLSGLAKGESLGIAGYMGVRSAAQLIDFNATQAHTRRSTSFQLEL